MELWVSTSAMLLLPARDFGAKFVRAHRVPGWRGRVGCPGFLGLLLRDMSMGNGHENADGAVGSAGWQNGPWGVLKRNCVYKDPWLTTYQDDVIRPDKLSGSYSTVYIKPGVCVIAMDAGGVVHLTREFHYAVGRITLEGVSGGIEEGESAEEAAVRELVEEIGAIPGRLQSLGFVDPLTSSLSSPTQLFLATQLTWVAPSPEGTETIERFSLSIDQALEMVMVSEISHAPTCVALLKIRMSHMDDVVRE